MALSARRRFEVLKRDYFRCRYCGRGPKEGAQLQVDHVKPVAQGGGDEMDNLVTACRQCNAGKADVNLSDMDWEGFERISDGDRQEGERAQLLKRLLFVSDSLRQLMELNVAVGFPEAWEPEHYDQFTRIGATYTQFAIRPETYGGPYR